MRFRVDRDQPAEIEQHHPVDAAGAVCDQAGKALKTNVTSAGPPVVTLFTTKPRNAEAQQLINEHKTIASIDKQVDAWHEAQPEPPAPVVVEHPIDETQQTGDSRLLGGPMSIHAPWRRD